MAGQVLTYSPSAVKLNLCGYVLTGVVAVSVQWNSAPFTIRKGIRGQHTRIESQDRQATVTLEVLQTSITNDILNSILTQDASNKSARLEFSIKDASGSTNLQTTECFISKYPDLTLSSDMTPRRWEIEVMKWVKITVGGNARQGFDVFDSINGAAEYISDGISNF